MHFDYLIKRFDILTVFDKIFPSYALGVRKPKPAIFELALKTAKVKPRQTIFIDDIKEHVESAARLGIKAILFTDVIGLKKELSTLGVLN